MNEEELVEYFRAQMRKDPDMASAVAAIRTLLEESLTGATDCLTGVDSSVAVSSGGELFLRFISLTSLEHQDLSRCKKVMEERGELFLKKISLSRTKVAKLCHTFIKDGAKILTHSYSRVVLRVLEKAAAEKKRFSVYVTESQPDSAGRQMAEALRKLNVPVTVVLDAAVGYVLEKVDLVIVGAEGSLRAEGSSTSFKFVRLYPLNQQDVPDKFKYKADTLRNAQNLSEEHPMIDYTPPSLITLLFTDLGVLTPSAVSDELIKLYL
ncbi:hypothetical protein F7725_015731 [Dissostichus mawsoni]|uniref:Translation initiation factor eIF2B subunit alpha n=1 Tax=Dissostichus mawsoni TaxID=36200 RepID=A0A7J5YIE2_DISMA|nr:hypothetical protein F7725_015731 [Dissostichus mawsoni]